LFGADGAIKIFVVQELLEIHRNVADNMTCSVAPTFKQKQGEDACVR
jgi:hypothetical protein